VLQGKPALKPKQVQRAKVLQVAVAADVHIRPSPSILLQERSLSAILQERSESVDAEAWDKESDIDHADRDNVLAVCDYSSDIFTYYRRIEPRTRVSSGYMISQVILVSHAYLAYG
jgi:hypothetical protein